MHRLPWREGIPIDKDTPVIAGQTQGYLYFQLRDYKSGARKDDRMSPVAQMLERPDMMAPRGILLEAALAGAGPAAGAAATSPPARSAPTSRSPARVAIRANIRAKARAAAARRTVERTHAATMLDFRTRKRGNNPGIGRT